MKIIKNIIIVGLGLLLLSGCGGAKNTAENHEEDQATTSVKKVTNPMAAHARALEKAKDVERLLLEASKKRMEMVE